MMVLAVGTVRAIVLTGNDEIEMDRADPGSLDALGDEFPALGNDGPQRAFQFAHVGAPRQPTHP